MRHYAAAWIAISASFVMTASAQDDAPMRTTIEKFFVAFNSGDASAATELWRPDAVDINFSGMVSGKAPLQERVASELKLGVKFDHTIDRIDVAGPIGWAAGHYTVTIPASDGGTTQLSGAWLQVLKADHGTWKIQAASFTRGNQPNKE